jgi:hypothetical protein
MKRGLAGGLVFLVLVGAPTWAATIEVGDHVLAPDTPNQVVPILVTGGEAVAGLEFFAVIGGGGAANGGEDGPGFEEPAEWAPAMVDDTIWDDEFWVDASSATTVHAHPFGPQFAAGSVFVFPHHSPPSPGATTDVPAEGVLIKLLVDTTGWSARKGPWTLQLSSAEPFGSDPTILADGTGAPIGLQVIDGSISLIPEPTAVVMLWGLAAGMMLCLAWRRRAQ